MVVNMSEYKQAWEFGPAFVYSADPGDVVSLLKYIQVSQERSDGTVSQSLMVKCDMTGVIEVWASPKMRPYVDDSYERIYST